MNPRCERAIRCLWVLAVLWILGLAACTATPAHAANSASQAFSFGWNDSGRTGLGTSSGGTLVATPINTTHLTGKTITQVDAGAEHSLLLADDGSVFSFGDNSFGRTGRNTSSGSTLIPAPITTTNLAGKKITQVAAGYSHSLLLADDGSVFSFGLNVFGPTGLNTSSGHTLVATPIDTTNLAGKTITQVAAGGTYSLLLADDGSVFSFGWNDGGRAGLGPGIGNALIATPIDATNIAGKKISEVAAGHAHGLLLADDGNVFSFGWNTYGQTGLNTSDGHTFVATPIDMTNLAGKRITQVAAGSHHSLLLADDGSVFSFGLNLDGRTGLGTGDYGLTLLATPIDATNLAAKKITQIAGGDNHSLLLASDGSVFAFGANGFGKTGLGTHGGNTLVATPINTTNLAGKTITQAAAGTAHSLLVVVPEPSSLALTGLALLSLAGLRRRRVMPAVTNSVGARRLACPAVNPHP